MWYLPGESGPLQPDQEVSSLMDSDWRGTISIRFKPRGVKLGGCQQLVNGDVNGMVAGVGVSLLKRNSTTRKCSGNI